MFGHLLALLALKNGVCNLGGDQLDGTDGVVVAGNDVIDVVGITVGINYGDYG